MRRKTDAAECFISYARGDAAHERWIERNLATDLVKAGVNVILDRWENAKIGGSIPRFVERAAKCDFVIVVGTPLYRQKYDSGKIVAAEGDLVNQRMTGSEEDKESVLPLLLDGDEKSSFPPLLHRRVHADFRVESHYFESLLMLALSLFDLPVNHLLAAELRDSLRLLPMA